MLPKLQAFYFKALLPELASPRDGKCPGIREPGLWVCIYIYTYIRLKIKPNSDRIRF
jgi:hypothetical protein